MPKIRKEYENQNGTMTLKGSMPVFDSNNDINLLNNINIPGAIVKEGSGSAYTQQLQSKSGTIALLGDIPTISGTNDGTNWTAITINNSTYSIPAGGVGSINWGDIGGTLASQTDLYNELNNRLQFYTLQVSDIAGISGSVYTFTADFRSKVASKKYRIEIPAGFIANDVAWYAYPTGMTVGEAAEETTNYYTYLATFSAYVYKFIIQDKNGILTLNTTTGVGPASDEYSFSAEENHLGIWSEDKGTVGDLYGRPLNGNALIGGNSLYPSDDANQFLINRSDAIIGATTVSADFVEKSALLYYKQLSGATYSYLPLATQSWVSSQGYITSSALNGYATEIYVGSAISALTYVSVGAASATHTHTYSEVGALSAATYIPAISVNPTTTTKTLTGLTLDGVSYAIATGGSPVWGSITGTLSNQTDLQNALNNKLDSTALNGYATESWVLSKNYITSAALNGYATETYVSSQISALTYSSVGALSAATHIPTDPVNPDWSATTGLSSILNKPNLGTAAFSEASAFASTSHAHNEYVPFDGGIMTGRLVAQNNITYTTAQVRNIILSTSEPTSNDGNNGDIWIVYKE